MTLAEKVNVLVDACHGAAVKAGWWNLGLDDEIRSNRRFGKALAAEKIALIHSEVSEALEGVRNGKQDAHLPQFTAEEVEMVDALIRIFDYGGARQLRLGEALVAKMAYNTVREDHKPEARAAVGGKAF